MARIRSVHPGLFVDEAFIQLSDAAQIFFVGLWTEADDQGVFEWKPATLKLRLRGASTEPVEPLLAELAGLDCIKRYEVGGRKLGAIRNFQRFQRPKKPNCLHVLPAEFRTYVGSSAESSEPKPVEADPVPQKSEKSPQMEDGGGRKKEESPPNPPRAAGTVAVTAVEVEFEERFWPQYPRKVDKGHARRAYAAARKKTSVEAIIEGLRAYRFPKEEKFIPHPGTWLNGERWQDKNGLDLGQPIDDMTGTF